MEFPNNQPKETAKRKELPPTSHIFVEVGPDEARAAPIIGDKKTVESGLYVAVELNHGASKKTREALNELQKNQERKNHFVIEGNATKMSFLGDSSVDEIYFGNVFGDPKSSGTYLLLKEAKRVLKKAGRLVVREDMPASKPLKIVELDLTDLGFVVEKVVRPHDPEWKKEINVYSRLSATDKYLSSENYLLFARLKV